MKKLIALCTIAIAACVFAGCNKSGEVTAAPQVSDAKVNDATKEIIQAANDVIAAAKAKSMADSVTANGKLASARTKLASLMSGLSEDEKAKINAWLENVVKDIAATAAK